MRKSIRLPQEAAHKAAGRQQRRAVCVTVTCNRRSKTFLFVMSFPAIAIIFFLLSYGYMVTTGEKPTVHAPLRCNRLCNRDVTAQPNGRLSSTSAVFRCRQGVKRMIVSSGYRK